MRSAVRSGVLLCTKCTSLGSVMPASFIALRTPAATFSTIGRRPISSGRIFSETAKPTVSRSSSFAARDISSSGTRAKMLKCGEITPSQPPESAIGTCSACSRVREPFATKKSRSTRSTRIREMSFTPPLPSVFATTATMSSAPKSHCFIAASMPEVSCTCSIGTLQTTNGMAFLSDTEELSRVALGDSLDVGRAEIGRLQACKRIPVSRRERVITAEHDAIRANPRSQIAQRLRVVKNGVVPHAPQVTRGLAGSDDALRLVGAFMHDVETPDEIGQGAAAVGHDDAQLRKAVEHA